MRHKALRGSAGLVSTLILYCAAVLACASCSPFPNAGDAAMVDAAKTAVDQAMSTSAVFSLDDDDPMSFFRKEIDGQGDLRSEITRYEVSGSASEGDAGEVRFIVDKKVHFGDGTSRTMPDYPTLYMKKVHGEWVVVDIHVPL